MGMVLEPVTDLELLDHGGHAHLVLLGEAIQVAKHALVHGRRRRRPRKRGELGFGASGRNGRGREPILSSRKRSERKYVARPTAAHNSVPSSKRARLAHAGELGWAPETVQRAKICYSFDTWAKIWLCVPRCLPASAWGMNKWGILYIFWKITV